MDLRDALPAELAFWGLPVRVNEMLPEKTLMVVTPIFDRFGHMDYAATVNSSLLFENVGNA